MPTLTLTGRGKSRFIETCICPSGYAVTASLAQTFNSGDTNYREVTGRAR